MRSWIPLIFGTLKRSRSEFVAKQSAVVRGEKAQKVLFTLSLVYIVLLSFTAVAAPVLTVHSPTEQHLDNRFEKPGTGGHLLGTDNLGRDVWTRILYGSRAALLVGIISVSIAVTIGTVLGLIAGLSNRAIDNSTMLLMDALLSFPTILLAIAVVALLGYGLVQVMLALGVIFSPVFARLVRAETLAIKAEGYVESSRALGSSTFKTVIMHFLPNMMGKVIVQCAITFALSVVIESSLSFLGLGTQPPNPSWGLMLKDARNYLFAAPQLAVFPGLAIALTVLSFNIFGDVLAEKIT